jgi:sigma-54 specific flagellar transcriptional regulator A
LPDRYRCTPAVGWLGSELEIDARPQPEEETLEPIEPSPLSSALREDPPPLVYEITGVALPRGGIDLKDHLSAIEIGLIRKALEEADGTVAEAARLLRIRRTTLVEKLRKYHLSA